MGVRLVVGRIVKPHGIKGEVVVQPETDNPERLSRGAKVFLRDTETTIVASRPHQGRVLVLFSGIADRNAAESLRNVELQIDAEEAMELPDGSYYPHQLQGFEVVDAAGDPLGTLTRVEENPANDLWVVSSPAGEVLVPAVRQIVVDVDLSARRITLSPPEGMFQNP
jgi:16S rRNA processing protein RimM